MARGERSRAASGRAGRTKHTGATHRATKAHRGEHAETPEREHVGSHVAERALPSAEERKAFPVAEHLQKDARRTIGALGRTADSAVDHAAEVADSAQAGLGTMTQDMMSNAGEVVERSTRTMQQLMAAKTLQEVVRLQFDIAGILIDAQMRYVQALTRLANDLGRSTAGTFLDQARQAARQGNGRGARRS